MARRRFCKSRRLGGSHLVEVGLGGDLLVEVGLGGDLLVDERLVGDLLVSPKDPQNHFDILATCPSLVKYVTGGCLIPNFEKYPAKKF